MHDNPIVTTIIPTYRRPQLLRRAIKSALAQEGAPLQVCVYDNASGDETAQVVAEIAARDPRVKYFCHRKNIGGVANFQYGLEHVDTPFFSFLSDDDVLLPGFYSAAINGFDQHEDAMLWAGATIRMDPSGLIYDARIEHWPREGLYTGVDGLAQMTGGLAPGWTGALVRQEVIATVGLLDLSVGYPSDLDWILRIAARHSFVISKRPVAILVLHPESASETGSFSAFWPGWTKMIENVINTGEMKPEDRKRISELLHSDARKMLFRRAAAELSKRNYSFAGKAANVLSDYYRNNWRSTTIKILIKLCAALPPLQRLYTKIYTSSIHQALASRKNLQQRHEGLKKYLDDQMPTR